MKARRRIVLAGLGLVAVVLAASGCIASPDRNDLRQQAEVPGVWLETNPDIPRNWLTPESAKSGFELRPDGTAMMWNMRTGTADLESAVPCFKSDDSEFTGTGSWEVVADGVLHLRSAADTLLVADEGFIDSLDWVNLTLAECEASSPLTFAGETRED
ncbi:hypothetical protein AB1K56_07585 [Microbacterium sp. BWR-S6Y]|uniref:hypothetical protein n=1 Tax=Microbacterium sp. BWR-S6Y TaxID=3232073 RepID=UPI0035299641